MSLVLNSILINSDNYKLLKLILTDLPMVIINDDIFWVYVSDPQLLRQQIILMCF